MINFSIVKRENPIDREVPAKYYAHAQMTELIPLAQFAKHVAQHGSVYTRADVAAVLTQAVDCLREMLLDGKKVNLGDLGNFYNSLKSEGAESMEAFSAAQIKAVNVKWEPGEMFSNLVAEATFQEVGTRAEQAALLKLKKAGEDITLIESDESATA